LFPNPCGPEAYWKVKELRVIGDGNHAPKEARGEGKLHALLDSVKVKRTSMDVVRIGNAGESFAPVIVWNVVMPASLYGVTASS
jgi:hypothetical protein